MFLTEIWNGDEAHTVFIDGFSVTAEGLRCRFWHDGGGLLERGWLIGMWWRMPRRATFRVTDYDGNVIYGD